MTRLLTSLLCAAALLTACADKHEPSAAAPVSSTADRVFVNGRIWTGSGNEPAQALAIAGDTIVKVGSTEDIRALVSETTEVVDLDGHLVVPGFIDNHTHFILSGLAMQRINLRDADTKEEFIRRIAEQAQARPGEWIIEGSWDHELWGGELPTRDWIDQYTADTPVFVLRFDRHMALANSAALKLAGVDETTPDVEGGSIIRDEQGRVTGLFKDAAMELVDSLVPPPSDEQIDTALQAATDHALSEGVTQVHDMGEWGHLQAFIRARDQGRLRMRIYESAPIAHVEELKTFIAENGRGDDMLRWGGVKGFVDGSLGSTTAWFHQPYDDEPGTSGLTMVDLDELAGRIRTADAAGLQVAIHAIGDRANDWLLDTFEQVAASNGPRDRRFRIEHAQHLSQAAIPRFDALGVIPSVHPYHAIDDGRWAIKRIGADRIKRTYAFRSLLDAGATLSFGSDWAVAPIDPMLGTYAAVTRRTLDDANPDGWVPEQKITLEEALAAYTTGNAYTGFQEDRLGALAPGYLADFVVLSQDILDMDPVELPGTTVLRTVLGGKDVYIGTH